MFCGTYVAQYRRSYPCCYPKSMFPDTYVPHYPCFSAPIFPETYVIPIPVFFHTDLPQNLCFPVSTIPVIHVSSSLESMFPDTYVPRWAARYIR